MGGEKPAPRICRPDPWGSPPHGRGKGKHSHCFHTLSRITPAWAGKRFWPKLNKNGVEDHPRMGGEKRQNLGPHSARKGSPPHGRGKGRSVPIYVDEVGSPPHGRGKVCMATGLRISDGITPAWAGKRLKRSHRSGIFISGPIPFHSVLHRPAGSGGSRAGRDGSPAGQPQNAGPA